LGELALNICAGTIFEEYGGVSRHIFDIKKFSRHRISIVPPKLPRILLNRFRWAKQHYKKIVGNHLLHRYDALHSQADPWFEKACQTTRSNACKWVHTFHSLFFPEDYEHGLAAWQETENQVLTEICSQADIRITVSKWLHDYLQSRFHISTLILEHGIDLSLLQKINGREFTDNYKTDDFILYVGGFREVKNPVFFVSLAEEMPKENFLMIGERLDKESFLQMYHIKIPENLIMLGSVPHEMALSAMAACKIYVMTSKRESLGYTLLEAMALGKPVVAPDHSGPRDILADTKAGLLYRPDSLADAVKQIRQALASQTIGQEAKELVAERFNVSKQIMKLDDLYSSLQ